MAFLEKFDACPADKKIPLLFGALRENPDAVFAELRSARPILLAPPAPPAFPAPVAIVTKFRDVEEALRRWEVFTVKTYAPGIDASVGPFMLARDDQPLNQREKSIMLAMLPREDMPMIRQMAAGLTTDVLSAKGKADRKSTRLNSSHVALSRMPSSA